MKSFFVALQFLTRISLVRQDSWTAADFGRSVKFFPLVGAALGLFYGGAAYLLGGWLPSLGITVPRHLTAVVLLALPLLLTGGLHADGFMDTIDGVFSGRPREKMLEIMKDSRTGAYGVVAFVLLMFLNFGLLLDIPPERLPLALFIMPVIGRSAMVLVIWAFPYARAAGMGKAFAEAADGRTFFLSLLGAALFLLSWGREVALFWLLCLGWAFILGRYVSLKLGGVTGDVYGAAELTAESMALLLTALAGSV